ncbi:hypothetical protein [Lacticaseibacillus hulanensis]|uniref:hypothetical protein n=1 Tax=Lacticaseibacillus hulanensis TaxID=2493111 RepID=UPI0013E3901D|nr:hypothetical protein [Lacticaseibacillus hulanensis]
MKKKLIVCLLLINILVVLIDGIGYVFGWVSQSFERFVSPIFWISLSALLTATIKEYNK